MNRWIQSQNENDKRVRTSYTVSNTVRLNDKFFNKNHMYYIKRWLNKGDGKKKRTKNLPQYVEYIRPESRVSQRGALLRADSNWHYRSGATPSVGAELVAEIVPEHSAPFKVTFEH